MQADDGKRFLTVGRLAKDPQGSVGFDGLANASSKQGVIISDDECDLFVHILVVEFRHHDVV
jgi:hypothetical protein